MLKPTIQTMIATARRLWQRPGMLAVFATLYAVLIATLYAFAMASEASFAQVLLTLLLSLAASLEFMMLQAAIIDNAQNGTINWPRILRNSLKLVKVTLPVIIFSVALFLVLNRWESGFTGATSSQQSLHWPALLFSTLRWLLFGITLPLATIHLWIQAAGGIGEKKTSILRRGRTVLSNAFTPASVLTYTIGLVLFALVPYAILFLQLPLKGARTDFPILIGRLVLVFLTTLFGWVLTVTASAQNIVATDSVDGEDAAVKFNGRVHRRSQFV